MVEEQLKQLAEVLQYTLFADKKQRQEGEKYFIFLCSYIILKGYLRYKTITSQNVTSKAQIKNFFIS